jgi:hypothetical protein
MNEDFTPFELAVKLKEKGFNYPCIGHYVNNQLYIAHYQNAFHSNNDESVDAPTISQVLKWLIEEKKIHIIVEIADSGWYYTLYPNVRWENGQLKSDKYIMSFKHKVSYEQSALAGIEYVLDNLI